MRGIRHRVRGLCANTIIERHFSSKTIDFLSLNIEGAEYPVLRNLDFSKYSFNAVVVEHNFRSDAKNILTLFEENGCRRVCEDLSGNDHWFVPTGRAFPCD
jgi:hypothetical protein